MGAAAAWHTQHGRQLARPGDDTSGRGRCYPQRAADTREYAGRGKGQAPPPAHVGCMRWSGVPFRVVFGTTRVTRPCPTWCGPTRQRMGGGWAAAAGAAKSAVSLATPLLLRTPIPDTSYAANASACVEPALIVLRFLASQVIQACWLLRQGYCVAAGAVCCAAWYAFGVCVGGCMQVSLCGAVWGWAAWRWYGSVLSVLSVLADQERLRLLLSFCDVILRTY